MYKKYEDDILEQAMDMNATLVLVFILMFVALLTLIGVLIHGGIRYIMYKRG